MLVKVAAGTVWTRRLFWLDGGGRGHRVSQLKGERLPGNVVLVSLGCCGRGPQTGGLKRQKRISSQFWRPEAKIQVLAGLAFCEAAVLGLHRQSPPRVLSRSLLGVGVLISS